MKKKNLLGAYLVLSLLASCQQKENLQHMGDELKLSLPLIPQHYYKIFFLST